MKEIFYFIDDLWIADIGFLKNPNHFSGEVLFFLIGQVRTGDDNDRNWAMQVIPEFFQKFKTVHDRHDQIQQNNIQFNPFFGKERKGIGTILSFQNLISGTGKCFPHTEAHVGVIIHQHHLLAVFFSN